ncbi:MAG: hypothetical protein KME52_25570 [Desmonostoc geniculatum HA4340-LM1]|nr:hypothetical protein [Desmonostoc geniculatum HA4340-LM1]
MMNFQRSMTMGSLTLAIALFAAKPVFAYKPPVIPPANLNSQPSSFTIAQLTEASSPIYGTWKCPNKLARITTQLQIFA